MGGPSGSRMTIAEALRIAKDNQNGSVNPQASEILERNDTKTLEAIQAQPTSYIMTQSEYSVINYFQQRHRNDDTVKQAIARFWKHYKPGESHGSNHAGSASSSSTAGR